MKAWQFSSKIHDVTVTESGLAMKKTDSEESTLANISYKQSRTFTFALMICGIPISRCNNALSNLCRFGFLTCCILTFLNTCVCLTVKYSNFYSFTLVTKAAALVSWWSMYRKKNNYNALLKFLSDLKKKTKDKSRSHRSKYSIMGFFVFFFAILSPPIGMLILRLKGQSYKVVPTCHEFWIDMSQNGYVSYHFFLQLARQLSNWGVPFSATLFYSFYCNELANRIEIFQKVLEQKRNFRTSAVLKIYAVIVKAILELEDSLSFGVLFVLFTNFAEAFRSFTLFFSISNLKAEIQRVIFPTAYFLQTTFLFMLLIYSADTVQRRFNSVRKSVLTLNVQEEKNIHEVFRRNLKIVEDRELVKLTAWGMVEIKRTLILTAVASLITYGVLLSQLSSESAKKM
ncbi:uncharacterized protein NPIL_479871 [Nephila pilipes]|uniref:Gustatory receptor n=1 Tax=Nephila pilipes TaxID=299642 RepID=A0A8X6NS34_NEPPI|nr:uncharacterized protein NPIL_479871 [Nephila pilipes]